MGPRIVVNVSNSADSDVLDHWSFSDWGQKADTFELVSHRAEIGAEHLSRRAFTVQGRVAELDNNLDGRREGMR
jgi:hypothetical protein